MTDFELLAPLVQLKKELEAAGLAGELTWILPLELLPGRSRAWGIPIIRADVPKAFLAHGNLYLEQPRVFFEEDEN
jgi:hypothetical protein